MIEIMVSYPNKDLSPNARKHWSRVADAKKAASSEGFFSTRALLTRVEVQEPPGPTRVQVTIHPPDNRRRDMDNVIASLKAVQDGIASALGVDDHLWQPSYKWGERVKGGEVIFSFPDIEVIR